MALSRHGSLFSGIGGFDLAAEWMGWENVFHCELNPFGRKVLSYYWPNAISYENIKETDFTIHRGEIDILTGGFPCQPFSTAGKRKGTEDDRHLWPEMLRAIREIQPWFIVGENVRGLVNWSGGLVFEQVQADLEDEGYEIQPIILPAASVNAPHRRDRVWFVAYNNNGDREKIGFQAGRKKYVDGVRGSGYAITNPNGQRWETGGKLHKSSKKIKSNRTNAEDNVGNTESTISEGRYNTRQREGQFRRHDCSSYENGNVANTECDRSPREEYGEKAAGQYPKKNQGCRWENFPTQSPIRSRNDGISKRLDGITFPKWRNESIAAYGNAIVPQVAYEIFKALQNGIE